MAPIPPILLVVVVIVVGSAYPERERASLHQLTYTIYSARARSVPADPHL
jgi:hypothetical protein